MNLQEAVKALQVRASSSSSTTVQALPEGLTSLPGRVARVESSLPRMQEEMRTLADLCRSSPPGTSSTNLMQRLDEVQATVLSLVESMHVLEGRLSAAGRKPEQVTELIGEVRQCRDDMQDEGNRLLTQLRSEFQTAVATLANFTAGRTPPPLVVPSVPPPAVQALPQPASAETAEMADLRAQLAKLQLQLTHRESTCASETSEESARPTRFKATQESPHDVFVPPGATQSRMDLERPEGREDPTLTRLARSLGTRDGFIEPDLAARMMGGGEVGDHVGFVPPLPQCQPPSVISRFRWWRRDRLLLWVA